ncbi:Lsr2 family protein [Saccharothrix sp.]|uniref:histone-like nucleoid-structuring protein Lsr2 n=1 Tax=Saccharothrix sp. TaxID=1873460 RepID=UPI002811E728|nr:Lsr2 family protein [Saccharothrix sp.]
MARKLYVQLVDDLDGRPAADGQTVSFGLDGVHYEIDLCPENAAELRERLSTFIMHARRVGKLVDWDEPSRIRRSARGSGKRARFQEIREWAWRNGLVVGTRGRIAPGIVAAFEAAHRRA